MLVIEYSTSSAVRLEPFVRSQSTRVEGNHGDEIHCQSGPWHRPTRRAAPTRVAAVRLVVHPSPRAETEARDQDRLRLCSIRSPRCAQNLPSDLAPRTQADLVTRVLRGFGRHNQASERPRSACGSTTRPSQPIPTRLPILSGPSCAPPFACSRAATMRAPRPSSSRRTTSRSTCSGPASSRRIRTRPSCA